MNNTTITADQYLIGDDRKGKQWARLITGVSTVKNNGFAFEGDFLTKNGESEPDLSEDDDLPF